MAKLGRLVGASALVFVFAVVLVNIFVAVDPPPLAQIVGYSADTEYIPLTRTELSLGLSKRDATRRSIAPNDTVLLDYGQRYGDRFVHYEYQIHHKDRHYVKMEDMEDVVSIQCEEDSTTYPRPISVKFHHEEDYDMAKSSWANRTGLLFVVHDQSCGSLDERAIYHADELTFGDDQYLVRIMGTPLPHLKPESASKVGMSFRWMQTADATHLKPRYFGADSNTSESSGSLEKRFDFRDRLEKNPFAPGYFKTIVEVGKKGVHAVKHFFDAIKTLKNHNWDEPLPLTYHTDWAPRRRIFEMLGIKTYCIDCAMHFDFDLVYRVEFDIESDEFFDGFPDEWDEAFKKAMSEATLELVVAENAHIKAQVEVAALSVVSWVCLLSLPNVSVCFPRPRIGDITYMGHPFDKAAILPSPGKVMMPWTKPAAGSGGVKLPFGSGTNKKLTLSGAGNVPLKTQKLGGWTFQPQDWTLGMALALSLGSNVNATLPGVDVIIPKGQHVKVDLLAPEEAQTMENTIHPEFQLIKPDLEFSNMSIDFTMSPGLWFAFGIGHQEKPWAISLGIAVEFLNLQLKVAEYASVDMECNAIDAPVPVPGPSVAFQPPIEEAWGISVLVNADILGWFQVGRWRLTTNEMKFPWGLGLTWPGVRKAICFDCKGHCPSQNINSLLDDFVSRGDDLIWVDPRNLDDLDPSEIDEETFHDESDLDLLREDMDDRAAAQPPAADPIPPGVDHTCEVIGGFRRCFVLPQGPSSTAAREDPAPVAFKA